MQESCLARLGGPREGGLAKRQGRGRGKPKMVVKDTKQGKTKPNCEDRTRREERAIKHNENTSGQKDTDYQNSCVCQERNIHTPALLQGESMVCRESNDRPCRACEQYCIFVSVPKHHLQPWGAKHPDMIFGRCIPQACPGALLF